MALPDRLRELAHDKGMNIKEFSSYLGTSERTVQNYLAEISVPNGRFLTDLAEKTGVSLSWFMAGIGAKYIEKHQELQSTDLIESPFIQVPRYMVEASAGHGAQIYDELSEPFAIDRGFIEKYGLKPTDLAVITVRGDSMDPELRHGDLILLDLTQSNPEEMQDGDIYAINFDGELFVKRIQRVPGRKVLLISSNPRYQTITINASDFLDTEVRIIGRVIRSLHHW